MSDSPTTAAARDAATTDPSAAPEVSIVIVTYNSPEWTQRCLEALAGEGRPRRSTEVVIVDSGSQQPTVDLLTSWSDRVRVLLSPVNVGFGRGCNLAAAASRGRYIVLLNPDAVVRPGCIDALVDAVDAHPQAGLVGGRTLRPDGSVDPSSCWGRPTLWSTFCFATGLSTALARNRLFDPESMGTWQRDTAREVDIVTGCLVGMTRATWDTLGGFDEQFFMYGEDADLSLRARTRGWRPRITPDAVAVHAVGASSAAKADKVVLLLQGKSTLARKHHGRIGAAATVGLLVAGCGLRALGEAVRRSATPVWRRVWQERGRWSRGFDVRPALTEHPVELGAGTPG